MVPKLPLERDGVMVTPLERDGVMVPPVERDGVMVPQLMESWFPRLNATESRVSPVDGVQDPPA